MSHHDHRLKYRQAGQAFIAQVIALVLTMGSSWSGTAGADEPNVRIDPEPLFLPVNERELFPMGARTGLSDLAISIPLGLVAGIKDEHLEAGTLRLRTPHWSPDLATPARLQLIFANPAVNYNYDGRGVLREVLTPTMKMVVEPKSAQAYDLVFGHRDQPRAYMKVGISIPGENRLLLTETNHSDAQQPPRTKATEFVYEPLATGRLWKLGWGVDPNQGGMNTCASWSLQEQTFLPDAQRMERRAVLEPDGTITFEELRHYRQLGDDEDGPEEIEKRVIDPQGAQLTYTWTYYENNKLGVDVDKVKFYQSPTGYWEHYFYDEMGELKKTIMQYQGQPYDGSDLEKLEINNIVHVKQKVRDMNLQRPGYPAVQVIRRRTIVQGQVVKSSYELSQWLPLNQPQAMSETWVIESPEPNPEKPFGSMTAFLTSLVADPKHLGLPVTKKYRDTRPDINAADARIEHPDGQVTFHEFTAFKNECITRYSRGKTNAAGDTIVQGVRMSEGYDPVHGHPAWRMIETIDPVATQGQWKVQALTQHQEYDDYHRVVTTAHYVHDQAQLEVDQAGQGKPLRSITRAYDNSGLSSITDQQGRKSTYEYDSINRSIREQQPDGIVIRRRYDASDRVIHYEEIAPEQTTGEIWRTWYDRAGRVIQRQEPNGNDSFRRYRLIKPDGTTFDQQRDRGRRFFEVRYYPKDSTSGPVAVIWADNESRALRTWMGQSTSNWSIQKPPIGDEPLTELSRNTYHYDPLGRLCEVRHYHSLIGLRLDQNGEQGSHYFAQRWVFDALGRRVRHADESGVITAWVYDRAVQVTSLWRGSSDHGATLNAPDGSNRTHRDSAHVEGNNMQMVRKFEPSFTVDRQALWDLLLLRTTSEAALSQTRHTQPDFIYHNHLRTFWVRPALQHGPWVRQRFDEDHRLAQLTLYPNGDENQPLAQTDYLYDAQGKMITLRVYQLNDEGKLTDQFVEKQVTQQ